MGRSHHPRAATVLVVALLLVVGACGGDTTDTTTTEAATTTVAPTTTTEAPTTTTEPATTTTAVETTTTTVPEAAAAVYFLLEEVDPENTGPFLVPVYREVMGDPALGVAELLVAGPTADEANGTPAMTSAIPEGTTVLGVTVDGGVATVDLSGEFDDGGGSAGMFARLAQVVYTMTRLDDVDSVSFSIEGEPVTTFSSEGIELDGPQTRDQYTDWLPAVLIDHPAWGEPVTSPFEVSGVSNVFEAVSQLMLTDDDGLPLVEEVVMATCGTGCWGEWSVEVSYDVARDQVGALIAWVASAEDGSQIDIREQPVLLR
jgi:spore germination protein GerM